MLNNYTKNSNVTVFFQQSRYRKPKQKSSYKMYEVSACYAYTWAIQLETQCETERRYVFK